MAATLASTIKAFAGSVIRPASEAFVDWAKPNVNDVRRMNTNAATRRTGPYLTFELDARDYWADYICVNGKKSNAPTPQKSDARASGGKYISLYTRVEIRRRRRLIRAQGWSEATTLGLNPKKGDQP